MTSREDIQNLITNHKRRLQKLREIQALKGIDTDPDIILEIEDIEATLEALQEQLDKLEDIESSTDVENLTAQIQTLQKRLQKIEQLHRIPFTNREDETNLLLSSFAPPYHLLDAPAGYGKTDLLLELKRRFQEQQWTCVYVSADKHKTLLAITTYICQELNPGNPPPNEKNLGRLIAKLGSLLKQKRNEGAIEEGVVLLIDLDKTPSSALISNLVNRFIPRIYRNLQIDEFFKAQPNRFRVVIAGRYLASRKEITSADHLRLPVLPLSPFSYEILLDLASSYLDNLDQKIVKQLAAHIMYLSGGHPGGMVSLLKTYNEYTPHPDDFLEDYADDIRKIVSHEISQVKNDIPHKLQSTMEALSPCRRFNYYVLRKLMQYNLIPEYDEYSFADSLVEGYLVSRKDGFLQDGITRRLLAIRLRQEEPDQFIKISQTMELIYTDYLSSPTTYRPEIITIELLYQKLQSGYFQLPANTSRQRKQLANNFFATLDNRIQTLIINQDPYEMIANFMNALQNDWEFQFVLNYFFREDSYTDQPYQRLTAQINEFRQKLQKGE